MDVQMVETERIVIGMPVHSAKKARGHGAVLVVLVLYLLLPVLATLLFSFAKEWMTGVLPSAYTLQWYGDVLRDPAFLAAVGHTVEVGALAVAVSLLLTVPVIFTIAVYYPRLEQWLQMASLLPFAFPPVVSAIGLMKIYSRGPLPITGTIWILLAVYVILVLPFVYQSVRNSLSAIRAKELMEAAETLGANKPAAFLRIILPNIWSGMSVAAMLSFSVIFGEFAFSNLLGGGGFETIQVYLYNRTKTSGQSASAVVILYFAIIFALSGVVLKLSGRRKPKPAREAERGEETEWARSESTALEKPISETL